MGTKASADSIIEGKYRLERELGAGGMGSVWLATQLLVDRPVAVKILHPNFGDSDDLQARFEVEAKAIGRLNHPNVITLYDFGYSGDLDAFYTVIEYIDGESLDRRLDHMMSLKDVVSIVRQIALALDNAHHHGILHRDLKPENVMLARMTDGSEMVKVLDFGIARIVKGDAQETQESQRITKAGEVFGTPAYMSPEQARSIRQLSPAADLYSLGVMFYELVAGSLPFFANSAFDLLMLHVTKPVPPIRRNDVPEDLKRIIYKLLEKDPAKRFQSGKDLVSALESMRFGEMSLEQQLDDFENGPTMMMDSPRHPSSPPSVALFDRHHASPPPGFPVTTPRSDEVDRSAQTMMLDDPSVDFAVNMQTGSYDSIPSSRMRVAGLVAFLFVGALFLAFIITVMNDEPAPAKAIDTVSTAHTEEPPASDHDAGTVVAEVAGETDPTNETDIAAVVDPVDDKPEAEPIVREPKPEHAPPAVEDNETKTEPKKKRTRTTKTRRKTQKKPTFDRVSTGDGFKRFSAD